VNRNKLLRSQMVPLLVMLYDDRKMCACSTKSEVFPSPHLSWEGRCPVRSILRRRSKHRIIILWQELMWCIIGIEPSIAPVNVWTFNHHCIIRVWRARNSKSRCTIYCWISKFWRRVIELLYKYWWGENSHWR